MKKKIRTEIQIKASAKVIWDILLDFHSYPLWNPFIQKIVGAPKLKNIIQVTISPPGGSSMTFRPVITSCVLHKKFSWRGRLGIRGIFDGHHSFELIENSDGTTTLLHQEEFSGILVAIIKLEKTKEGFVMMNKSVKEIAEKRYNLELLSSNPNFL